MVQYSRYRPVKDRDGMLQRSTIEAWYQEPILSCARQESSSAERVQINFSNCGPDDSLMRCNRSVYIFDLISSMSFCSLSLFPCCCGQLIPRPSCSFGFGIMWKWTCMQLRTGVKRYDWESSYVVHDLVRKAAVVLKDVVVLCSGCCSNLFGDRLRSCQLRAPACWEWEVALGSRAAGRRGCL